MLIHCLVDNFDILNTEVTVHNTVVFSNQPMSGVQQSTHEWCTVYDYIKGKGV